MSRQQRRKKDRDRDKNRLARLNGSGSEKGQRRRKLTEEQKLVLQIITLRSQLEQRTADQAKLHDQLQGRICRLLDENKGLRVELSQARIEQANALNTSSGQQKASLAERYGLPQGEIKWDNDASGDPEYLVLPELDPEPTPELDPEPTPELEVLEGGQVEETEVGPGTQE